MCTRLTVSLNFTSSKIGVHSRSDAKRVSDSRLLAGLYQMGAVALRSRSTLDAAHSHFTNGPRHKHLKKYLEIVAKFLHLQSDHEIALPKVKNDSQQNVIKCANLRK